MPGTALSSQGKGLHRNSSIETWRDFTNGATSYSNPNDDQFQQNEPTTNTPENMDIDAAFDDHGEHDKGPGFFLNDDCVNNADDHNNNSNDYGHDVITHYFW